MKNEQKISGILVSKRNNDQKYSSIGFIGGILFLVLLVILKNMK